MLGAPLGTALKETVTLLLAFIVTVFIVAVELLLVPVQEATR
jgi:hypothetical protein